MTAIWRKHLTVCLLLGLLAIPIYFLDRAFMGEGGGSNWITLDFRGFIFWTYIALLAIHITLSSIVVASLPKSGAMALSVFLLIAGFVVYAKLLRAQIIAG